MDVINVHPTWSFIIRDSKQRRYVWSNEVFVRCFVLFVWLVVCLFGWLVGWLVGCLVGCLVVCS